MLYKGIEYRESFYIEIKYKCWIGVVCFIKKKKIVLLQILYCIRYYIIYYINNKSVGDMERFFKLKIDWFRILIFIVEEGFLNVRVLGIF